MTTALIGSVICAIAATIVLSPVTAAAAALLVLITCVVCSGVSGAERRLLQWILVAAIVLRVVAIAALFLWSDPNHLSSFPFDGDGQLVKLRSLWIRNAWLGVPIDQGHFESAFTGTGWTSYLYLLAYLQYLLGPAPYAIHLVSVCWAMASAGLLYRLVRRSFGSTPAFIALIVMLFLPTLFMWSVSAMKESWVVFLTTVALVGIERTVRGGHWAARAGWASAVVAAAFVLETTRVGSLFIVVGALLVTLTGTLVTRRRSTFVASLVVLPLVAAIALQQPSVQARVMPHVRRAAVLHWGSVNTPGYAYKLLDQRFYSGDSPESITWVEAQRFMVRALSSFVLVPFPWQAGSRSQLLFIPQQLLWYGLALLAVVGAVKARRKDAFVAWLFVGFAGVSAVVIAPHEGNIGTLVRHRDGIVPFVVCLSAIAIASMLSSVRASAAALLEDSVLVGRLRSLSLSMMPGGVAGVRAAWRESALAAAIGALRSLAPWNWLRQLGTALLGGAALAMAFRPLGSLAWPSPWATAVTAVCGLFLIAYAPKLVCAWREKHAPAMPIETPSQMTV